MTRSAEEEEDEPGNNIIKLCGVVYFHFFWGFITILLGFLAISLRYSRKYVSYHQHVGTIWMYAMIVQLYTSIAAGADGYQWFIFLFGSVCYGSLIIGHYFIKLYRSRSSSVVTQSLINHTEDDNDSSNPTTAAVGATATAGAAATTTTAASSSKSMRDVVTAFGIIPMQRDTARTIHACFMVLSQIMVTGAGIMFTRRFAQSIDSCKSIYWRDIEPCIGDVAR
jgi:hypothetical protein